MHITLDRIWYNFRSTEGYILREGTVNPQSLPDPQPVDKAALADLARTAFPDIPQLAEKLAEFGPAALTLNTTLETIQEAFGVTKEQAHRIAANAELFQRMFAPPLSNLPLMRSIEDVYRHCYQLVHATQEQLHVLLVNNRYELVYEQAVAVGGRMGIHEASVGSVIQPAIARRVSGIIIVHNHPSGDPTPSEEDYAFTEAVKQTAAQFDIEVMDHVVVATGGSASALRR